MREKKYWRSSCILRNNIVNVMIRPLNIVTYSVRRTNRIDARYFSSKRKRNRTQTRDQQ